MLRSHNVNDNVYLNFRESKSKLNFHNGVEFCIGEDLNNDLGANLMPVGELRKFKNRYDPHGNKHLKVQFNNKDGPFFVNAVKSHDGEWREFGTGNVIR